MSNLWRKMSVKVRIHPFLIHFTGGQEMVEVRGKTVGQCLDSLEARFPGLKSQLFDKRGQLHGYVEIYVNEQTTYPEELNYPVNDGDELTILFMAAGG